MKTLLLILVFSISIISLAQNPPISDNTWYLQKINIDGIDYKKPYNAELHFIRLRVSPNFFNTQVCNGLSGHNLTISNTEINVFEFELLLGGTCSNSQNTVFEDQYYNDFLEYQFLDRTYSYTIEEVGSEKALILTNSYGDKAFYTNIYLAVNSFNNKTFSIYPNPSKDRLILSSNENNGILKIKIYNIEGKLLSNKSLKFEDKISIDVSNLSSGMYFLNIKDENGQIEVKKFIKE